MTFFVLGILITGFWFPSKADLEYFLLWMGLLLLVFIALLIGSFFVLRPQVELVPEHGPIRLDI